MSQSTAYQPLLQAKQVEEKKGVLGENEERNVQPMWGGTGALKRVVHGLGPGRGRAPLQRVSSSSLLLFSTASPSLKLHRPDFKEACRDVAKLAVLQRTPQRKKKGDENLAQPHLDLALSTSWCHAWPCPSTGRSTGVIQEHV
ncbi:uncharacterized protein PSFLO_00892 [Pseudozyma flocculosa]|uniref:Uncharacterized protein n=1 Tax=Pseudozyma flocculosa TaxID=84751 RepID=A0A5C3EWD7_9BASI|nr:uncharacterized protein PSFLO_00892 [Pseudozyma flocculosa]